MTRRELGATAERGGTRCVAKVWELEPVIAHLTSHSHFVASVSTFRLQSPIENRDARERDIRAEHANISPRTQGLLEDLVDRNHSVAAPRPSALAGRPAFSGDHSAVGVSRHRLLGRRANALSEVYKLLSASGVLISCALGLPVEGLAQVVRDTHFSHKRGFYDAPFELRLSTEESTAVIRYTTDGSVPTRAHGEIYTGALLIQETTVVRAMAYTRDDATNVDTQTYIFIDQVARRRGLPKGYPAKWSGLPADYEMDPEVTEAAPYSGLMREALLRIPTISIVMDVADLFREEKGIYQNPRQKGKVWERPASVELIYPPNDGRDGFQEDAGIRISGGGSRDPANSPKHSFRLLFKAAYGSTKLRFPLFGPEAAQKFDTIVLRAGYNNTWIHHNETFPEDERSHADYIRDQWTRDLQLAMGQPSAHGFHVHLYLNGLYWGLYNVHERPDASFSASYFGGEKEQYDALNGGEVIDGDRLAWDAMMALANGGLSTPEAYSAVQKFLDVTNLADYIILNHFVGNHEWDYLNWYATRKREAGAGYRFFSWDAEHVAESVTEKRPFDYAYESSPTRLFQQLRENPEFRTLFADRIHKHLFNGGALTPERLEAAWMARAKDVELAVVAESARWGDYRRDVHRRGPPLELYRRDPNWISERNRLLRDYFPNRTDFVLEQYKAMGLYPALKAPVFSRYGGSVSRGFALEMTNPDATGIIYYTLDGSDPRGVGGGLGTRAQVYGAPIVLDENVTVKARVKDGSMWSALNEATFTVNNRSPFFEKFFP